MKAVILAGGFATRLRPLSCTRPKILFPIVNKPLLQWTLERLARNGIEDVVLAAFHQTELYIRHSSVPKSGFHIRYSFDPPKKPLGTGGSIKKVERRIGKDAEFLALNGDIFADVDYRAIVWEHKKNNCIATIALHAVKDPSRYGVAKLSRDNQVTEFIEKPQSGNASSSLINAGVYVLSSKIFDYIPRGKAISIEREIFPKLVEEGELYGHVYEGLWMDIGKPSDYLEANRIMLDRAGGNAKRRGGQTAELKKPLALDLDVSVGRNSIVGPYTVLGCRVSIGKNVHIRNCVVMSDTVVSDFATLDRAIIGEDVYIGKNVRIPENCTVGDHARIHDGVHLSAGTSICPACEVVDSVPESSHIGG